MELKSIYVQRVAVNGSFVGGQINVGQPLLAPRDQVEKPDIAALANGGFVVRWTNLMVIALALGPEVRAQVVNASGAKVGGIISVQTNRNGPQSESAVIGLANGDFVAVWSGAPGSNGYDIYMQRFNASGGKLGGEVVVNSVAGTQARPDVVALSDGTYIVGWSSTDRDGDGYAIMAQRYNQNGTKIGSEFRLNAYTQGEQDNIQLAARPDGGFVAVWGSSKIDGSGKAIVGNVFGTLETLPDGYVQMFGGAGNDTLVGTDLRDRILGEAGNDSLSGGLGNDILDGGDGNDTLDGGAGADSMAGGVGDDTYIVDNAGDIVFEAASNEGIDTVRTSLDAYTLTAGVDNLVYTSTGWITATGNALDNSITGGAGSDTLDGGAGRDTLTGGAGDDTYFTDRSDDVVVEAANAGNDRVRTTAASYTLSANIEDMVFIGTGGFTGTGNSLANAITGGDGDDSLSGAGGADTLIGGGGNDIYVVDNAGDIITELAGEGTDSVQSSVTYTLSAHVENLTLTGGGAINATGNDLANSLTGNSGANRLDGGTGADTMAGGAGDDIYLVDDAGDIVTEAAGQGTDRVETALAAYTLGANLENLIYTGSGDFTGTGNADANSITGGAGNDTLDGGAGTDTLTGGAGADRFVVDDGDTVTDFLAGDGDKLDLSGLDADSGTAGSQAFTWIDNGAFTNVAGELRWEVTGATVKLLADRDGDGNADLEITLAGITSVTSADLIL